MIIAHPGARSVNPVNGQLIMESSHMQYVHNILIAMPGSQLTVASFCFSVSTFRLTCRLVSLSLAASF